MSQMSLIEDLSHWSVQKCKERFSDVLPKLHKNFVKNDAEYTFHHLDLLQKICHTFTPVIPLDALERALFSRFTILIYKMFTSLLDHIVERCTTVDNEHVDNTNVTEELTSCLNNCLSLLQCLESCVHGLMDREDKKDMNLTHIHSLHTTLLEAVCATYLHCKDSNDLYGSYIEHVSDLLPAVFKKAHALQTVFIELLQALDLTCSQEDAVHDFCCVARQLYEVSKVAVALDKKFKNMWKTILRLCSEYKQVLIGSLDVNPFISFLCDIIIEDYNGLCAQLDRQATEGGYVDQKVFANDAKYCQFELKVVISLTKDYNTSINQSSIEALYQLLLHLRSQDSTSLQGHGYDDVYTAVLHTYCVVPLEPLLSNILECKEFSAVLLSNADEAPQWFNSSHHLAKCKLLLNVMELCLSKSDAHTRSELLEQWMPTTTQHTSILHALFICIPACHVELSLPVTISAVVSPTKAEVEVSLYEHIYTQLCRFVAQIPASKFSVLEDSLMSSLLSTNTYTSTMAIDVWSFIARYGPVELCRDHCMMLCEMVEQTNCIGSLCITTPVVLLLRRLIKFMKTEHQIDLLNRYKDRDNSKLWSILPVDDLPGDTIHIVHSLQCSTISRCCTVIDKWIHTECYTGHDAVTLINDLRCTANLLTVPHNSTDQLSSLITNIQALVAHIYTHATAAIYTYTIVQHVVCAVCMVVCSVNEHMDNAALLKVLSCLPDTLTPDTSIAVLTVLSTLSSRNFPPCSNQQKLLLKISGLLGKLISSDSDNNSSGFIQQYALKVFAKVAQETPHESLPAEVIHTDKQTEHTCIDYMNKWASQTSENTNVEDLYRLSELATRPVIYKEPLWQDSKVKDNKAANNYADIMKRLESAVDELTSSIDTHHPAGTHHHHQQPLPPAVCTQLELITARIQSVLNK